MGRKPLFVASLFVPGVCCVAAAYLAPGTALFTVLVMGAKLGASAAFNITERVLSPYKLLSHAQMKMNRHHSLSECGFEILKTYQAPAHIWDLPR